MTITYLAIMKLNASARRGEETLKGWQYVRKSSKKGKKKHIQRKDTLDNVSEFFRTYFE